MHVCCSKETCLCVGSQPRPCHVPPVRERLVATGEYLLCARFSLDEKVSLASLDVKLWWVGRVLHRGTRRNVLVRQLKVVSQCACKA